MIESSRQTWVTYQDTVSRKEGRTDVRKEGRQKMREGGRRRLYRAEAARRLFLTNPE